MITKFSRNMTMLAAVAALAGSLALSANIAVAADKPAETGGKISKAVTPQMIAVQKAAAANNWQEVMTQAQAALAVPDHTPFDEVEINTFIGIAAVNLKDMNTARKAFETAADNPANADLPPAEREQLFHNSLILSAGSQEWQKAIAYGQVLEQMGKNDDATYGDIAVAYYNLKDSAHAQQYAQKSIAAAKAAGKQPDENALKIVMNSQIASNPAAAEQTLENIVMRTNSAEDWGRLIDHTFGVPGTNDATAMDLYRLKFATNSLRKDDAALAGKLANELYYYGDAERILQSQGIGGPDLSQARSGAAKEQGSLNAEIAAGRKGSGQDAIRVGEALYGYGRYAEAEELGRAAMAKGLGGKKCRGHCDPATAATLVGMAQVAQGKNAEAIATLNAVTGSEADRKTAHLWAMYAQLKQGGAPPAAAPAPAH
jgi:tetratricopeptide (TPR) repeat protein